MTITITKKHVAIVISIIALISIAYGLITLDHFDYEGTAKEAKLNMKMVNDISSEILSDYHKNWSMAISDNQYYDEKGELRYTYKFSEAIQARYNYFTKKGYINVLDSLDNKIKEDMTSLEKHSSKHKDVHSSLLKLYNTSSTLYSLVKDPKGSLLTFTQRVNDLAIEFENNYRETDLKISIPDSIQSKKSLDIFFTLMGAELENIKKREAVYMDNKKAGEEFIKDNAKKDGIITLPSGLQYKVIKEGSGKKASETSKVRVYYEGKLIDGTTIFDSNLDYEPTTFRVNQVISGLGEALTKMPEGSEWEIYIPQELGYGENEMDNIKPYSALIFRIKLIKVLD